MKRAILMAVLALGLVAGNAMAAPTKTVSFTEPTNYEDGTVIPVGDLLYNLHCDNVSGAPYTYLQALSNTSSPSAEDFAFCVNGLPGTYFAALTAVSVQYSTESIYSNEISFLVSPGELGKVPLPPVINGVT